MQENTPFQINPTLYIQNLEKEVANLLLLKNQLFAVIEQKDAEIADLKSQLEPQGEESA